MMLRYLYMLKDSIVLDLDDTLYAEIDFLKSAYTFIANTIDPGNTELYSLMIEKYFNHEDVFNFVASTYNTDKTSLLNYYRFHKPLIELYSGVEPFLKDKFNNYNIALVTDGRSLTQRNKIEALGIERFLSTIIISEELGSEKPNAENFQQAIASFNNKRVYYIGDNIKKDFVTPNKMGWTTICLIDPGHNIHKQDFSIADEYLPHYSFRSWSEIHDFFNSQQ